jgi:hypothetical protein
VTTHWLRTKRQTRSPYFLIVCATMAAVKVSGLIQLDHHEISKVTAPTTAVSGCSYGTTFI